MLVLCRRVLEIHIGRKKSSSVQLHCLESMYVDACWCHFSSEQHQGFVKCHESIPSCHIDRTMIVLLFHKKDYISYWKVLQQSTEFRPEKLCLVIQQILQGWDRILMGKRKVDCCLDDPRTKLDGFLRVFKHGIVRKAKCATAPQLAYRGRVAKASLSEEPSNTCLGGEPRN